MYGLEKKSKTLVEFDLEKDLKKDPAKLKLLVKHAEEKMTEIKHMLRQGASSEQFDQYGVLLHGYAALQKTLNKIARKK